MGAVRLVLQAPLLWSLFFVYVHLLELAQHKRRRHVEALGLEDVQLPGDAVADPVANSDMSSLIDRNQPFTFTPQAICVSPATV